MTALFALLLFNSTAFFLYGISCLFTENMKNEFIRFGLNPYQRIITGVSQLLGSFGLILGYFSYDLWISLLAATGLFILMLSGFIVRVKIKDSLAQTLPSFLFMLFNLYLIVVLFNKI